MVNLTTGLLILFWLTVVTTLAWIFITAARASLQSQPALLPLGRPTEPDAVAPVPDLGANGQLRYRARVKDPVAPTAAV